MWWLLCPWRIISCSVMTWCYWPDRNNADIGCGGCQWVTWHWYGRRRLTCSTQYTACTALYCNAAPDCWQSGPFDLPPAATRAQNSLCAEFSICKHFTSQRETAAARARTLQGGFARYFCSCWHERGYCSPETLPKNVTALVLFYLWFHEKLKLLGAESRSIYRGCICWGRARIKPKPTSFH